MYHSNTLRSNPILSATYPAPTIKLLEKVLPHLERMNKPLHILVASDEAYGWRYGTYAHYFLKDIFAHYIHEHFEPTAVPPFEGGSDDVYEVKQYRHQDVTNHFLSMLHLSKLHALPEEQ